MIKGWKLFLDSKEILYNIEDILIDFKYYYKVNVYITSLNERLKINFDISGDITTDEIKIISQLNNYLISEDFEPVSTNGLKDLDIRITYKWNKSKNVIESISRLIARSNKNEKSDTFKYSKISFSYWLPPYFTYWNMNDIFKIGRVVINWENI